MNKMQNIIQLIWLKKWAILFCTFLGLVTFLLFIELPPKANNVPYVDKIQHTFVFAILYGFGTMAWKPHRYWLAAALILFGALVEPLQSMLTSTRQASVYDWLADIAGIVIAVALLTLVDKMRVPTRLSSK